jgi:hypothetical protein
MLELIISIFSHFLYRNQKYIVPVNYKLQTNQSLHYFSN